MASSVASSGLRPVPWLAPDVVKDRGGTGGDSHGGAGRGDVLCPNLRARIGDHLLVSRLESVDAAFCRPACFN